VPNRINLLCATCTSIFVLQDICIHITGSRLFAMIVSM
jgi:hypothetical protein